MIINPHVVERQFNALMMIVIKRKLKDNKKRIARQLKYEQLFSDMTDIRHERTEITDTYFYEAISFGKMCLY